jgi:hypothetical protein
VDRYVGQVESAVDRIMAVAEDNDGHYAGSLEELLPWSFWVQELSDPHNDVERMFRVWHGDYIECYHFGEGTGESYGYLFRDGLGFGYLSITENMGFQYFRYFFNREHALTEISRGRSPSTTTAGLPSEDAIANVDISDDDLPEFLSFARSVAIGYVAGDDYSDQVRDLVLQFRGLVTKESH